MVDYQPPFLIDAGNKIMKTGNPSIYYEMRGKGLNFGIGMPSAVNKRI
jgi:hypothetical protein